MLHAMRSVTACIRQIGLDNLMNSRQGGAGRIPNDTSVGGVYWSASSMEPKSECHSVPFWHSYLLKYIGLQPLYNKTIISTIISLTFIIDNVIDNITDVVVGHTQITSCFNSNLD